jgi:hypothetical protein
MKFKQIPNFFNKWGVIVKNSSIPSPQGRLDENMVIMSPYSILNST